MPHDRAIEVLWNVVAPVPPARVLGPRGPLLVTAYRSLAAQEKALVNSPPLHDGASAFPGLLISYQLSADGCFSQTSCSLLCDLLCDQQSAAGVSQGENAWPTYETARKLRLKLLQVEEYAAGYSEQLNQLDVSCGSPRRYPASPVRSPGPPNQHASQGVLYELAH